MAQGGDGLVRLVPCSGGWKHGGGGDASGAAIRPLTLESENGCTCLDLVCSNARLQADLTLQSVN